ncbi:ras-related protein Rab-43 isoform X3 [Pteropus medius]|uniref:ras-related protein Rab-43 isoform X3 n=1 Tax=Pteropus vampyrus TaxID=132908 RepID=UPI00196B9770|nr:ras-related protein Rab-43 isoform X3 [Pteropus giganteus]
MAGPGPGPGDPDEQYDFLFKLVLVGDASVGKTCVVQRFKTGAFSERQSSTIGVDFTMKTLEIQGKRVKLQIWDTAGQERFRTITQSYYRSANGAILAYDITKRSSFLSVPHWIEDVRKYAGSNIVQLLIGRLQPQGPSEFCPPGLLGAGRTSANPRMSFAFGNFSCYLFMNIYIFISNLFFKTWKSCLYGNSRARLYTFLNH